MTSQARPAPLALALALGAAGCAPRAAPPGATGDASGAGARPPAADGAAGGRVRPSAFAGDWYPGRRALITVELARLARAAAGAPRLASKPVALVVPHAGWAYSGAAAAAAFATLARGDFARVVVVGPSHHAWLDGFAVSDAAAFATPLGRVPICPEARALTELAGVTTSRGAHDPEHAIEIELPFLQQALGDFCLVPLLTGDTTPDQERSLAERLARLDDGRTLFVFSTDFVHYGESFDFTPFGPSAAKAHARVDELDERAIRLLEAGDADELRSFFATTGATICGRRGLSVLLELLARAAPGARGTVLAHYSSLELEPPGRGDDGVWYVAMAFERAGSASAAAAKPLGAPRPAPVVTSASPPLDAASGQALTRLARAALECELAGSDALARELDALPPSPLFDRAQAVFVTLTRAGALRGCVGQLAPEYPLPEAVVQAALAAALEDGRFAPVGREELASLALEVTVLTPPRPVASHRDIVLGRHGIVRERGGRRALFLPQVPGEQGWDVEATLAALSRKAGLAPDAWRERDARLSVFEGQVFEEAPAAASGDARGED